MQCNALIRVLRPLGFYIAVLQSMPIFCRYGCGKELSVLRRLVGACADCDPNAVVNGRPQKLLPENNEMKITGATEHNEEGAKWPLLRRRLRVVEIFAGSISGTRAMMQAEVPHRLVLACDNSSSSKQYSENISTPEIWCEDVKALADTPKYADQIKDADVVIAGPECVAWSSQGKRQGIKSIRARTQCVAFIEVMRKAKPKMIVMENVRDFQLTWFCSRMEARMKGVYRHYWRIFDARSYGLPQRRIRLYIVFQRVDAVLQSMKASHFAWPCPSKGAMTLSKYKKCYRAYDAQTYFRRGHLAGLHYGGDLCASERKQLKRVLKQAKKKGETSAKLIVDLKTIRSCNYGVDVIPTITASGAASLSLYHCGLQRRLCVEELAIAQGFELQHCVFEGLRQCNRGRLVGNAMISPLIGEIIRSGLKHLRL